MIAGRIARKFARSLGPSTVRKLSGWNCTPSSGAAPAGAFRTGDMLNFYVESGASFTPAA